VLFVNGDAQVDLVHLQSLGEQGVHVAGFEHFEVDHDGQDVDDQQPRNRPRPTQNAAHLRVENSEQQRHRQRAHPDHQEQLLTDLLRLLPPDYQDYHRLQDVVHQRERAQQHQVKQDSEHETDRVCGPEHVQAVRVYNGWQLLFHQIVVVSFEIDSLKTKETEHSHK